MPNRLTPEGSTPSIRFFALRADAPATITASEPGLAGGWRRSLDGQPLATGFTALSFSDLAAVNSTHSAGGLIVVDAATGEHRLDLPSAAAASGADALDLLLSATDTDLVFVVPSIAVDLSNYDGFDAQQLWAKGRFDQTDTLIFALEDVSYSQVLDAVQEAIENNFLDRLFAVAYNVVTKPGDAAALLNILFANDAGVPQFTANALELNPTGGGGATTTNNIIPVTRKHRVGDPVPIDVAAFVGADFTANFVFTGDLTGETFTFAVETAPGREDVAADETPNVSYDAGTDRTTITPTIARANHTAEAVYSYALRHVSGTNAPIARGDYVVSYAPDYVSP